MNHWTVHPGTGQVESSKLTHRYQVIVGLEIHAQLNLQTKLFSSASLPVLQLHTPANNSRCFHPFDAAVPGTMPILNGTAVRMAVLSAAALQCQTIAHQSRFERKHYAYADLPHGYQITQQRWPLARNGLVECAVPVVVDNKNKKQKNNKTKTIQCRIHRIQLEMDTGKTTTTTSSTMLLGSDNNLQPQEYPVTISRVDGNRAGAALIEIVTEPDLRSSVQAVAVVRTIRQLLQHCDTCRGRMEAGQLRVDCNVNVVSIAPPSSTGREPRTVSSSPRVEIKNLNSLEQVGDAIEYEAKRHAALLSSMSDEPWIQEETRTWNVLQQQTELIRRKDAAEDYRFIPEPDIPPVVLNALMLKGCRTVTEFVQQYLPELPAAAVQRLQHQYSLTEAQASGIASNDPPAIAFFDTAVAVAVAGSSSTSHKRLASKVANLLRNELLALVKENQPVHSDAGDDFDDTVSIRHSKVSAQQLGEIVVLLEENVVSNTMARKLMELLYQANDPALSPRQVAMDHGLQLVTDPVYLTQLCRSVLEQHPDLMAVYRRGGKYMGQMHLFFMGKTMEASHGNAHPERLREILWDCLAQSAAAEVEAPIVNDTSTTPTTTNNKE